MKPRPAKPRIIIAQVEATGTELVRRIHLDVVDANNNPYQCKDRGLFVWQFQN
jgi:hypothetical protein